MLVDRREDVVKALVLGIDNSLIPAEISYNEIHKHCYNGHSFHLQSNIMCSNVQYSALIHLKHCSYLVSHNMI